MKTSMPVPELFNTATSKFGNINMEILLLILFGCYNILVECQQDYLFFAAPQSLSPFHYEGLYGGPIRYQGGGNASEVYRHGLTCVQLKIDEDNEPEHGLPVKSVSFDALTSQVIMHVGEGSDDKHVTVIKTPVCAANHGCPNKYAEIVLKVISYTHKMTAFVIYADQVYFISERTIKETPTEERKLIELRLLDGCGEGNTNPFTVDRCSSIIAVVVSETFKTKSMYKTTYGLVVVPTKPNKHGNSAVFFVQLQHTMNTKDLVDVTSSEALVLYRVTYEGEVSREHEELVHDFLNRFVVVGVGQVTYRDGLMCWTALDRVVCGEVDTLGRLSNARVVMEQKEVKKVCKAPPGQDEIATITTGVAIAKVPKDINRDELVFYFGCMAQVQNIGGAGLVRKTGRGIPQVFPLRNDRARVLAGSMFMTTPKLGCGSGEYIKPANMFSGSAKLSDMGVKNSVILLSLILYWSIYSSCLN